MIAHIEGILSEKNADSVIVDCSGVGCELAVSAGTLAACPPLGKSVKLYAYLAVHEDDMSLYGFISKEEKRMFMRLTAVSGVGPKIAMGILGALSVHDLSVALVTGDAATLARAPGVGRKTAQRLVLELKDKVSNEELTGTSQVFVPAAHSAQSEAIEALMALGYASSEAARAVSQVGDGAGSTNEIVFQALKRLGGGM